MSYFVPFFLGSVLGLVANLTIKWIFKFKEQKCFDRNRFIGVVFVSIFGPGMIYVLRQYVEFAGSDYDISAFLFTGSIFLASFVFYFIIRPFS